MVGDFFYTNNIYFSFKTLGLYAIINKAMLSEFKNFFVSMLVKTKNTSSKKKVFTFALLFLFLYSYVLVFAIPPSSPYLPSDNATDPSCAPGDTNCFVAANLFDAPLVESGGVVSLPAASASVDGYLSASDWNTFNNKQNALTFGNLTATSNPEIIITGGTGAVIGTGLDISIPDASLTTRGLMTTTAQEFAGVKNFADGLGIGDSSPSTLFSIGTGGLFQVDASGDLVKINNINYTWPAAQAAGSGYVLTNDGSGGLSWSTGLSIGGTSGQLQYNNAGALGGVSGITFDGTNFDAKDSVFRIVDNSDTTKRAIFEVSGIDTGTTRTYTLPNTAGTIALTSDLSGYLKNSIGIAGGTTLIGGTASGQNLTLQSTSNATKGKIIFGTSAYDEVNNRLGIGTISPTASLDVSSPSGGVGTGIRLIQATNNVVQPFSYTSIDFTVPTTGLIGQFFATASNYSNPSVNLAANSIGLLSWDTNAQLLLGAAGSNGYISFDTGGYGYSNERMRILANGNVGIGQTSPTAVLHIKAGTATAGTAPLKFTSGTNLTTPEAGVMEYDGTSLFFTRSGALRAGLLMTDAASPFNTYSQSAKGATAFTSGTDNFLGGQLAGGALTAGSQNVLIGTQAGNLSNAGLSQAVFLGYFAGQSASGITTGSVFIGSQAGQNGAGSYNSNFVGQLAGFNASSAYHSNLFGYQAGYGINANNVNFFGQNAGYGATNASNSIFIGQSAGSGDSVNNSGDVNDFSILIGKSTSTGGFKNSIAIGGSAANTASNQFMIGSATRPIDTTRINGSASTQCTITTGTGIACTSDERVKTNIADLSSDTLTKLSNVKTVTYNWLQNPTSKTQIGFLAQDLEQYFPELVETDSMGMKSVYYAQMTPILVEAIREMNLNVTQIGDMTRENTWRDSLIAWFGNITNGIQKLFAKEVHTETLCVGETCLTETQVQQILEVIGSQSAPSGSGSGTGTTTGNGDDPLDDGGSGISGSGTGGGDTGGTPDGSSTAGDTSDGTGTDGDNSNTVSGSGTGGGEPTP